MASYDLIVIGGGPAGYVGAIRAAQLGKKVACVEKERAGGTCLNWGCIPTKSLLRNAELYQLMTRRAEAFGFSFEKASYDWAKIIKRSREVSDRNASGIEFLFKKNKIDYIRGEALPGQAGSVTVKLSSGGEEIHQTEKTLIATGCVSRPLPGLPFDHKKVIGSKEAMVLGHRPESMIVIGAGAIGMEFAFFYNAFGTRVTVIEMLPNALPSEDTEVSQAIEKAFAKQGITILVGAKTTRIEVVGECVRISLTDAKGAEKTVEAEVCLVAIGVQPVLPGGERIELTERGFIKTDERYETSLPGVFAAGDIIGPPLLAHVASFEAIQAVEGMFKPGAIPSKVSVFPSCTYCQPQVASIGLTERAAVEQGLKFKVGKFPFLASGKARAIGETDGFVKLIIDEENGTILGGHIVGAEATELIGELGLAIKLNAKWEDIEATIHAHPTLSEAVHEAAGQAFGRAIHL